MNIHDIHLAGEPVHVILVTNVLHEAGYDKLVHSQHLVSRSVFWRDLAFFDLFLYFTLFHKCFYFYPNCDWSFIYFLVFDQINKFIRKHCQIAIHYDNRSNVIRIASITFNKFVKLYFFKVFNKGLAIVHILEDNYVFIKINIFNKIEASNHDIVRVR